MPAAQPDLMAWAAARDAERLRSALITRIAQAKPRSRKRIVLEEELKRATAEALKAETRHDR